MASGSAQALPSDSAQTLDIWMLQPSLASGTMLRLYPLSALALPMNMVLRPSPLTQSSGSAHGHSAQDLPMDTVPRLCPWSQCSGAVHGHCLGSVSGHSAQALPMDIVESLPLAVVLRLFP